MTSGSMTEVFRTNHLSPPRYRKSAAPPPPPPAPSDSPDQSTTEQQCEEYPHTQNHTLSVPTRQANFIDPILTTWLKGMGGNRSGFNAPRVEIRPSYETLRSKFAQVIHRAHGVSALIFRLTRPLPCSWLCRNQKWWYASFSNGSSLQINCQPKLARSRSKTSFKSWCVCMIRGWIHVICTVF